MIKLLELIDNFNSYDYRGEMAKKVSCDVEGHRQKCPRGPFGLNVG